MDTIFDFIQYVCLKYSDKNLFDDITYTEVFKLAKQRAAYLQKLGVKKGSVVALLAVNGPAWCITHISICITGATVLALDGNLPSSSHQKMMDRVGVKYAFVSKEFDLKYNKIKNLSISQSDNLLASTLFKKPSCIGSDIASFLFTSGTTAEPKIVQLTHSNIVKTSIAGAEFLEVKYSDVFLCVLPLYHVYALIANIYAPIYMGASMIYQPSLKGPDILQSLNDHTITVFPAVPQLWELFFDSISRKIKAESLFKHKIFMFMAKNGNKLRKIGLSFIVKKIFTPIHDKFGHEMRYLLSGGAPLKEQYHRYWANIGFKIVIGYGLTETTGPVAGSGITELKPGFTGKSFPGNETQIRNKKKDGIGQIWVRGIAVMPGYYQNEKANAEVFDADGWFNTGDIGLVDKSGDLRITGREKNVIVLDSGKNVYPEELEAYYQSSSLITELAVFGRQSEGKDIVFAVIVPEHKTKNAYTEIKQEIQKMNKDLPTYMIVNQFAISFDPLPRTSSKKIVVREIEKNLSKFNYQSSERDKSLSQKELIANSPKEEAVINILKKKLKKDLFFVTDNLNDFDIDSLGKIDLIVFLEEELCIQVNLEIFAGKSDISEIVIYLAECQKKRDGSISDEILKSKIKTKPLSIYNPLLESIITMLRLLSKSAWRLKINNPENLITDNSIIVSNHQSNLDAIWILSSIPRKQRKNIYIIGKKELKYLKYIFPGIQTIFVERKSDVIPALKAGADVLRQGKSLLIFPEGTRTLNGTLLSFKTGAAYLAMNLNKKIIPMTINGSFKIMPKKRILPKLIAHSGGSITIHPAIDAKKYKSIDSLTKKIKTIIKSSLV